MINFFEVLIPLMLVHIICEFYIQPKCWNEAKYTKGARSPELYFNSLLHGVVILLPAWLLSFDLKATIYLMTIVSVSHVIVDLCKAKTEKGDRVRYFVIQQTLYLLLLTIIAFYMAKGVSIESLLKHDKFFDVLMVTFAYLLILKPASVVIGIVLKKYPVANNEKSSTNGLAAGGELIGYLERVLILTFTLVGSYAAVGFVLAAKSIFRFGELSKSGDRSMTEYVLIGSLLSMVITIVVGTLLSLALGVKIK